jgi:hypothetical protein
MKKRTSAKFLDSRFWYLGMVGLPAPISSELMYAV